MMFMICKIKYEMDLNFWVKELFNFLSLVRAELFLNVKDN